MTPISTTKKVVCQIMIGLGTVSLIVAYGFWPNMHGQRSHVAPKDFLFVIVFGVIGFLLLGFGYEPFYRRRDEQLEQGVVPDNTWGD